MTSKFIICQNFLINQYFNYFSNIREIIAIFFRKFDTKKDFKHSYRYGYFKGILYFSLGFLFFCSVFDSKPYKMNYYLEASIIYP